MKNNYNERAWAIDVITEINLIVAQRQKTIRRAGGERTLKSSVKSNALFPDVLLFQDDQSLRILQGWELKMPDTPITDGELLKNAAKKANLLGLNSFLVWNVSEAALYILEGGQFVHKHQWSDLSDIKSRAEVEPNKDRWVNQLGVIINDLEAFFARGEIKSQNVLDSFSENKIIDVITGNTGLVRANIIAAMQKDAQLTAVIEDYWETTRLEYSSEPNAPAAIAKQVLITWVNRFLFTHYLKTFSIKALEIDNFSDKTTVQEAKQYFNALTAVSDFLNVFAPVLCEEYIDQTSWEQILQLNSFFSELELQKIDQVILQQLFEQLLLTSKRKAAGQYATPYPLASYLARITISDKTAPVMDAFCGTGTILRASYDLKIEGGILPPAAIASIWGSDKFSFPLQMSTLSLARPEVMGQVINIFKSDIKDVQTGTAYDFIDPNNGAAVSKNLPPVKYVLSNLPFVEASTIKISNPGIFGIGAKLTALLNEGFVIPPKSDLIAYLPYYLWHLLTDDGRLGLIVSNSWLGTDWGEDFRKKLSRFFKIKYVVTSGSGKWFTNADVVTNIIVLEKRSQPVDAPTGLEETSYITLTAPLSALEDKDTVTKAARQTLLNRSGDLIEIHALSVATMTELKNFGLGQSSYFTNLTWFNAVKPHLIKASTLFDIQRGERRGWDKMFYPPAGHGIEAKYIQPVLKNFRKTDRLIASPDAIAFCCSATEAQLQAQGDTGALAWIKKFENGVNERGKPLTTSLKRAGHHWYEMKANTMADLIGTINYDKTIFIAKMQQRSFVNQRLIRFTMKNTAVDIDLCQALMNSYLGIFYVEGLGFGRGMGALDLSATKMRENLFILNPDSITPQQQQDIKTAFAPLFGRDIQELPQEIEMADRKVFENAVARAYGLTAVWDNIKASLLELYKIRMSVH